jgi:hypothetical protein
MNPFFKNKISVVLGSVGIVALFVSCGGGGGQVISNSALLLSTDYSGLNFQTVAACGSSATTCTPSGFKGRVFAASTMLSENGELGKDTTGYAMTFLADSDAVIERPDVGKTGSLTFDLTAPATFSGKISIPTEDQMPANPGLSRVEIAFDYIDSTFELSGLGVTALNKTWTVRTIFVNSDTIGGKAVVGGDLLIKEAAAAETEFAWCNASGCSTTTKPTSHHTLASAIAALAGAATREGNPNYAYYSVDFPEVVSTTYAEISDATRLWSLDFDITNAIKWTAAPSTFTTIEDILANFKLPYFCPDTGCDSSGITASLTIGAAGSATPAQ